jgi:lysophospholipase L1-like esterase
MLKTGMHYAFLVLVAMAGLAHADQPWTFDNNTRYIALGDSLAAGYGAMPTTNGYAYLLYQRGAFDKTSNTLFANAAVPGAISQDVLDHQLPQAIHRFPPNVVTVSVGGNDLLDAFRTGNLGLLFTQLQPNLSRILCGLTGAPSQPRVYIHNLFDVPEITGGPGSPAFGLLMMVNDMIASAADTCGARLVDVFSAFDGQTGLLLIGRNGAGDTEVHPSNAGYRAMAAAFEAAIRH